MAWNLNSDRPVYLQLIEEIERKILSGTYLSGERLPSVRELAAEAGVNPNTMQKALQDLERNGLLYTERTSGRFITMDATLIDNMRKELAKNETIKYLSSMKKLGYEISDILAFLKTF